MIGVEGQYLFRFKMGDLKDFIDNLSLGYFTVIEESGNLLPVWEIVFTTPQEKLLALFNEGNDLEVSYGTSKDDLKEANLLIAHKKITASGASKYLCTAKGIYSKLPYITKHNKTISDKKSGLEVLKEVAEKHFKVDFNVDKSEGRMHWIQPNTTDKAFIDHLWLHSYIKDSFIGTSICLDGTFRLRDIKTASESDPAFSFTLKPESKEDIYFNTDYVLLSDAGFINCWVGYGREKRVIAFEKATSEDVQETYKPFLALTNTLGLRAEVEKRSAMEGIHNANTHDKYWNAALRNVTGLALFSRESNILYFENVMVDIHPLDIVMFKDTGLDTNESNEYFSGLYIVGKVAKSIADNTLTTTLQLYRESFNAIKGDF